MIKTKPRPCDRPSEEDYRDGSGVFLIGYGFASGTLIGRRARRSDLLSNGSHGGFGVGGEKIHNARTVRHEDEAELAVKRFRHFVEGVNQ